MRYPARDVRIGDIMLFKGILQLVMRVDRLYHNIDESTLVGIDVHLVNYEKHMPEMQRFHPEQVVWIADRNCGTVTVL